jgi:hypothetical protein
MSECEDEESKNYEGGLDSFLITSLDVEIGPQNGHGYGPVP